MLNQEKELVINEDALRKVHTYAKLSCQEFGMGIECGGFLLAPKDKNDGVVYDADLIFNQKVTPTLVKAEPSDTYKTKEEYDTLNYKAIGCWHSHHNIGAWHSWIDNADLERFTLEIGTNLVIAENPRQDSLVDSQNTIHINKKTGKDFIVHLDGEYSYRVNSKPQQNNTTNIDFVLNPIPNEDFYKISIENTLSIVNIKAKHPFSIEKIIIGAEKEKSVVYSLVVDSYGKEYVEAGVLEWKGCEIKDLKKELNRKKGLKIRKVNVCKLDFTEESLREEIRRKIRGGLETKLNPIPFLKRVL